MNSENTARLSPPWHTHYNFIRESIGSDPCVKVSDMAEASRFQYIIQIQAHSEEKARALATILELRQTFGKIIVDIEVLYKGRGVSPYEPPLTAGDLVRVFNQALGTNTYFTGVKPGGVAAVSIFPIFKKEVIQFFNDDISDYYNNFNGVAADVFAKVLRSNIYGTNINPSTAQGVNGKGQSNLGLFLLLWLLFGICN